MTAPVAVVTTPRTRIRNPFGLTWRQFQVGVETGRITLPAPWSYPHDQIEHVERDWYYSNRTANGGRPAGQREVTQVRDARGDPYPDPFYGWTLHSARAGDWLILRHEAVTLDDEDGTPRYTVGPWYVAIYPTAGNHHIHDLFKVVAADDTTPRNGGHSHPNVNSSGTPCLGYGERAEVDGRFANIGWEQSLKSMLDDKDWLGLLFTINSFLGQWTADCYQRPADICGMQEDRDEYEDDDRDRDTVYCEWPHGTGCDEQEDEDNGVTLCGYHYNYRCERCRTHTDGQSADWRWRDNTITIVCNACYTDLSTNEWANGHWAAASERPPELPRTIRRDDNGAVLDEPPPPTPEEVAATVAARAQRFAEHLRAQDAETERLRVARAATVQHYAEMRARRDAALDAASYGPLGERDVIATASTSAVSLSAATTGSSPAFWVESSPATPSLPDVIVDNAPQETR